MPKLSLPLPAIFGYIAWCLSPVIRSVPKNWFQATAYLGVLLGRVSTEVPRTGAMQSMAEIRAQHDTFALSDNPSLQNTFIFGVDYTS